MRDFPRFHRVRVERGIYKRQTSSGTTRYEVAYLDSDKRQRWRTVATLREARNLRAELVAKIARGERVVSSRVTFAEFADEWLAGQVRLRPKTRDLYGTYLRLHIKPRIGRLRLGEITVDDAAGLIAEMQQGVQFKEQQGGFIRLERGQPYKPWTIRGVVTVLGRVMGAAERRGLIVANPVRKLERGERPKVERREFPNLDLASIGRLIERTPEKYRALVAFSVLTALRQSEALGLRWADVDTATGVIHVKHQLDRRGQLVEPKSQAAKREVPIPPSLAAMLKQHRVAAFQKQHAKQTDFVFASSAGTPLGHRNIVRRGLEPALKAAKLPKLTWHDLRHVAASVLIAEGASVAYLSRMLGHANPGITLSIYAHVFANAEHADRTRDRMEAAFGDLLL